MYAAHTTQPTVRTMYSMYISILHVSILHVNILHDVSILYVSILYTTLYIRVSAVDNLMPISKKCHLSCSCCQLIASLLAPSSMQCTIEPNRHKFIAETPVTSY